MHEKGAFTGADKRTAGKIEAAEGGTLFLDELGDMPLPVQAKMLRFLQERVVERLVERLGGRTEIPVDVRVVCATNQNLQDMVQSETFRDDLFFHVSELLVDILAPRERGQDRLILARHPAHEVKRRTKPQHHQLQRRRNCCHRHLRLAWQRP